MFRDDRILTEVSVIQRQLTWTHDPTLTSATQHQQQLSTTWGKNVISAIKGQVVFMEEGFGQQTDDPHITFTLLCCATISDNVYTFQ